jgi:hypothetical protein
VWGYVKDKVFVPLLSESSEELWTRTTEAVAAIDVDMIYRIWDEVDCRWDIAGMTRVNHVEHL